MPPFAQNGARYTIETVVFNFYKSLLARFKNSFSSSDNTA